MMDALDLFAGPGGWSLACQRLGITEYGIEIDKAARLTRDTAGFTTVHDDVWTFDTYSLFTSGLIASPPCQTFSAAGKGAGRKALDDVLRAIKDERWKSLDELRRVGEEVGDERTALVLTPLTYAWSIRPRWVALEQVPTVLPVWEAVGEVLEGWGYNVWVGNMHAEQYGVPQTRKRAILIASLDRDVTCPQSTHSRYYPRSPERLDEGVQKWVSMAEALGATGGQARNSGPGAARTPRSVDEPSYTIRANGSGSHPSGVEWLPDWTFRRPATTIVGSFKPEVVAAPGYRTTVSRQNAPDSVRVTVEEAGVLQSFPADFPWQGSKTKRYQQVGNAIPPLLAEAVLREATAA